MGGSKNYQINVIPIRCKRRGLQLVENLAFNPAKAGQDSPEGLQLVEDAFGTRLPMPRAFLSEGIHWIGTSLRLRRIGMTNLVSFWNYPLFIPKGCNVYSKWFAPIISDANGIELFNPFK